MTESVRSELWVERIVSRMLRVVANGLGMPEDQITTKLASGLAAVIRDEARGVLARIDRWERLSAVGERTASIVHELRNPLSVIETSAFLIEERAGDDSRIALHAKRIAEQVAHASEMVSELLDVARGHPIEARQVDVNELVITSVAELPDGLGERVLLQRDPSEPKVSGDARRLGQILGNLLQNAFDAIGATGEVIVSTRSAQGRVVVTVRDHGPGIPPDVLPHVFEPLFTTRPSGTGLGLSLSRHIARTHGGELTARNHPEGGACFELTLPAMSDDSTRRGTT